MLPRFPTLLAMQIFVVLICLGANAVRGGEPRRPLLEKPVFDPQQMFERMFGQDSEEDAQALAKVPVSAQEERQIGETAVQGFLAAMKQRKVSVVARGKEVQYLRDLVETIRPQMTNAKRYRTITVYLVQSPECEARAFPGGTLFFFHGLLELASGEASVVGIVGHELSHLDRGHVLDRVRRMKRAQQTMAGKSGFSLDQFFTAGTQFAQLWTHPFRPEDEAVADADGARWAYQAGYDPREMARLFLAVGERQKNKKLPLPAFLQSHPDPQSRHDAILKLYEQCQKEKPNDHLQVGKENLRRRVAWRGAEGR